MEPTEILQRQRTIRFFMSILFIVVVWLYIWIGMKAPIVARWLPVGMLAVGVPTFIIASIVFGRYRNVFDYEEALFRGRRMMANEIRGILSTISLAGGWMTFGGVFFFVLSLF